MSEEKKVSKTELFKSHLQLIIKDSLGVKVSKDKSWELFKSIMGGTTEFVLNQEDLKLPLAGVGNFEVIKTEPRGSKAGFREERTTGEDGKVTKTLVRDESLKVWPFVPRYRFYASSLVEKVVENHFNLGDHDIEPKHYGLYVDREEDTSEESKSKSKKSVKEDLSEVVTNNTLEQSNTEEAITEDKNNEMPVIDQDITEEF